RAMPAVLARCRPVAPCPSDWRTACSDWRRRAPTAAPATAQSFPASPAIRPDTRPLLVGLHAIAALSCTALRRDYVRHRHSCSISQLLGNAQNKHHPCWADKARGRELSTARLLSVDRDTYGYGRPNNKASAIDHSATDSVSPVALGTLRGASRGRSRAAAFCHRPG